MILSTQRITAADTAPAQWLYVLHGIYGAGRNWASVMRRVVQERPDWGVLLVDLREHGGSKGMSPPHTVEAAARDVAELATSLDIQPTAILGHSFGGKVALVFAAHAAEDPGRSLRQVWVVDSTPAARAASGSAWTMLEVVRALPDHFATRDEAVQSLVARGLELPTAQWMATNLEAKEGSYRWRIDFDVMEELMRSFFDTDAWSIVEDPHGLDVHLVRAEQSSVLSGETLARAERAAASGKGTQIHVVAGGHWVNADNPAAIEQLLVQKLPAASSGP
jgi:esterase